LLATVITDRHLQAIADVNIPVLLIGQEHEEIHSVIHDDYHAGMAIGQYVLEKGHRNIAYLGVTELDIAVGIKRKQGFTKALEGKEDIDVHYYETEFNIPAAQAAAMEILRNSNQSIVVCATDNIALGCLKAAYKLGIAVPDTLSVTGFGGYDVTEAIHPGITTAKFHYKEAGKKAAVNMVELVHERPVEILTTMNFEIIKRESVDTI